ncbi:E3 ubiquitin-protein ligase RNF103-like [Notothenia coriiceps]|uniref:E3 ubiquitin-protein ligase RNF103-like n=1 Tax=Notothenia coriiceps TaxID=8208 RepID=A0A6I9NAY0_9TELE|nr:PREDICTED: E3 ubiquitin-protein ligase RNF103-like [Notothenia coriiceps]
MWIKLFFLLLYFMVLFMLARLFEAVVWYETGMFSTHLVDPVSLSYKKLKTILESRGLPYSGLAEKKDVSELVEKSGELTHGELYSAMKKEKEQTEAGDGSTIFSGEMHFYELVEDTKDGIWLVQVIAKDREALLSQSNWGKMVQKVSQFGIRTGTFNCSNDYRSCIKRGWQRSTLIMSVPQTSASKGKVMLKEYNGRRIEPEHIFRWMTSHVAHRIKTLHQSEQLVEEWRSDPAHPVKMFLFACLPQPPAFFSALSVKFTGRIEFVFVDVHHWENHSSLSEIDVTQSPAYILKMPEGIYRYGSRCRLNILNSNELLYIKSNTICSTPLLFSFTLLLFVFSSPSLPPTLHSSFTSPLLHSLHPFTPILNFSSTECGLVAGEVPVHLLGPAKVPLSKAPHLLRRAGCPFTLTPPLSYMCVNTKI